jgi:hypothetical protein
MLYKIVFSIFKINVENVVNKKNIVKYSFKRLWKFLNENNNKNEIVIIINNINLIFVDDDNIIINVNWDEINMKMKFFIKMFFSLILLLFSFIFSILIKKY